jgi:hypothetical protein
MDQPKRRTKDKSPGKDTEFLDYVLGLAQRAEGIVKEAEKRSTALSRDGETRSGLADLKGQRLAAQCGEFEGSAKPHEKVERYWQSVRVVASVHFSGSARRFEESWSLFAGRTKTQSRPLPQEYWEWPDMGPQQASARSAHYCRASTLLTLFEALLIRPVPGAKLPDAVAAVTEIGKIADFLTQKPALFARTATDEVTSRVRAIKSVMRVHKQARNGKAYNSSREAIEELDRKIAKLQLQLDGNQMDPGLDAQLHDRLTLHLQQSSSDTPHFEIADIVSTLAGRYLNPSLQMRPSRLKLYTQSVEQILEARQPGSGSWQYGIGDKKAESQPNPFVNQASTFAPLSFLLDLPNSVLVPSIRLLATAIDEALSTLTRRLASERIEDSLNHTIYDGLMVGTAAAERLRDLVSHLLLLELRAEVPVRPVRWNMLSDSLGFLKSLKLGVIDKWEKRSKERPGAVLIFGPPGTGKTTFAASLVAVLNGDDTAKRGRESTMAKQQPGDAEARAYESRGEKWHFLSLSPADFARRGADQIIASAEEMFQKLRRLRRCVVLLDEMEEFLRERGPSSSRESRLVTTAFLPLLQDTVDTREIILLVATNFVGTIDAAISRRGRFDLILPMGPPDRDSRLNIIHDWRSRSERLNLDAVPLHNPDRIEDAEKTMAGARISMDPRIMENPEIIEAARVVDDARIKEAAAIIEADLGKGRDDLEKCAQLSAIVKHTQGYIWAEIRDFMNELVELLVLQKKGVNELDFELWKIRQEKVPMALSGGPGCDWRAFHDEAVRLSRKPNGVANTATFPDYWDPPPMPGTPTK